MNNYKSTNTKKKKAYPFLYDGQHASLEEIQGNRVSDAQTSCATSSSFTFVIKRKTARLQTTTKPNM